MQAVFDGPVSASKLKQALGCGLLGREAGDAVDGFAALFIGYELGAVALDTEDLADVGKVYVVVEFAAAPDLAEFQSTVAFIESGVRRGEKRSILAQRCLGAACFDCL